jgi:signal transduction histidine kinase
VPVVRSALPTLATASWQGLLTVLAGRDPGPPWVWRSRQQRWAAYCGLAAVTVALSLADGATQSPNQLLLGVAGAAPLLLVIRSPLLGWRIAWLALLLTPLADAPWRGGWPWGPAHIFVLLALFCAAGLRHPRAVLWWMWALSVVPWFWWLVADVPNLKGPIAATVVFTAVTVAVDSWRSRRRAELNLTAQAERMELEQRRRAVLEERARIARELHDVVAHHMSLIAVRAETAPYRLSDLPEPVSEEFRSLSEAARDALSDMRRLLGVLRNDDQAASRAPQPQLSDLPALVEGARLAGLSVELTVPAALDRVPAGVGVCAYRIVQESLSNASQHAPGASVTVLVDHRGSAVTLRVANGPGESGGPNEAAGPAGDGLARGHGLVGMRERIAMLGGTLSVGAAPDGGFVVSAVLPIGDVA